MFKDINYYITEWIKSNKEFFRILKVNLNHKKKKNIIYDENLIKEIHEKASPIFVLSTGRSGTKYLTEIFNLFTQLDVHHSTKPEMIYYSKYAYEYHGKFSEELKHIIDASRLEIIQEAYLRDRIFVETNNRITFFAYVLAELYPNSKFIHLIRHPGDFVKSGIARNWYKGKDSHNLGRILPKDSAINWEQFSDIEKISWLWNETNQFIEMFKMQLNDNSRLLTLKAEDLFGNKNEIINILDFIGMKNIDHNIIDNKLNKKINAQSKNNFPDYQNWKKEDKEALMRQIKINDKYNYDLF
ncbi:MAG: sulfotransferase [Ignavibacteriales bacterium]|nr:sulfotransferase [Ignavibacteriales bacterium]